MTTRINFSEQPVALRGRRFGNFGEKENTLSEIRDGVYTSLIRLANVQERVYNRLKELDLEDETNRRLAFYGTSPAQSWSEIVDAVADDRIVPVTVDEDEYTEKTVSAYENVEQKLRDLSFQVKEAKDEFDRTGDQTVLERYARLSEEFQLIATQKVRIKEPSKAPSLELQQAGLQKKVEALLNTSDFDLQEVQRLDYSITELQYEREFRRNVEGAYGSIIGYTAQAEIENLQNAFALSHVDSVLSYGSEEHIFQLISSFADIPASARATAFASFVTAIDKAVLNSRRMQDTIAKVLGRSRTARRLIAWQAAKLATKQGVRLMHNIQHMASRYDIDGDDVVRKLDRAKVNNPLLQALTDAVVEGMTSQNDTAMKGFFHAVSYDVNLSQVGLILLDRQREQESLRKVIETARDHIFHNWDGDVGKLGRKVRHFIDKWKLEAKADQLQEMLLPSTIDLEDLKTPGGRKGLIRQARDSIKRVANDPVMADIRGIVVGGLITGGV